MLYVGLHDASAGARVAAYSATGERLPNDEVLLDAGLQFP
jgi:hypothetical protein